MSKPFPKHARDIRVLIAGAVAALLVPAVLPRSATGTQDQRAAIERMMREFLVHFSNRDVAAFGPYFAEDATVFFPPSAFGPPSGRVEGRASIAEGFRRLYERVGRERAAPRPAGAGIQPRDLRIQAFEGFAVVTFHLGSDSARGRRTFVLRRADTTWTIVHLHASTVDSTGNR